MQRCRWAGVPGLQGCQQWQHQAVGRGCGARPATSRSWDSGGGDGCTLALHVRQPAIRVQAISCTSKHRLERGI